MKRRYVIDASFVAAYFAGVEETRRYIHDIMAGRAEAYMCEVNVAEFLYNHARVFGWDAALARHALLRASPIVFVGLNEELVIEAARLKVKYYRILSLADCFLVALAKLHKADVLTCDPAIQDVEEVRAVYIKYR